MKESLFSALNEKRIAGAALDVFEVEPPTNTKLLQLPNIICSPHIAAQTKEAQELCFECHSRKGNPVITDK